MKKKYRVLISVVSGNGVSTEIVECASIEEADDICYHVSMDASYFNSTTGAIMTTTKLYHEG
ncbi:hypothetical protein [Enterobacter phage EspM4VN]|uniref:Uncharacterized protein n=1 Tax=Enterobacter phage EspM4VN TaxID=2137745 RepID=A0A4P2WVJ7_9CAUD|nr:hypothetical protein HYP11_gp036 [Enterobacter phage EspM4VN]BBK03724.1 hypothetical protein [Enterobacter phage EspM4VN]